MKPASALRVGIAGSTLAIVAAMCVAAAWSSVRHERAQPDDDALTLSVAFNHPERTQPRMVDEPIALEIRLSNASNAALTLVPPATLRQLGDRQSTLRVIVLDSSNTPLSPARVSGPDLQPVTLCAGAFWGCQVNVLDLYRSLPPDAYRVRVEYEATADNAHGRVDPDAPPAWIGRLNSAWQAVRVVAPQQERVIGEYARKWITSLPAGDLRSLQWLAANALQKGTTAARLRELLGEPTTVNRDAAGQTCRYRVGRTGLEVRVENDRIATFGMFEQ
jgi:hypothetical protein